KRVAITPMSPFPLSVNKRKSCCIVRETIRELNAYIRATTPIRENQKILYSLNCRFILRCERFSSIISIPSHHGEDIQNLVKESPAGIAAFANFHENRSVAQKENTICVTCRKGIVRHH